MQVFYIYILYSSSSDRYYVGYTSDFRKRLLEHNDTSKGKSSFTRRNGPWELKCVLDCGQSESEAIKIERWIKNQKSKNLIKKIIAGIPLYGPVANLVRVSI
ncbi:MAG: GIY-YIG nuclease family protein [Chryseotalea sp. WA131a]|nr:MAG: GIY-YIG nuclease family protein [Chryseotalea sp. WA131a]